MYSILLHLSGIAILEILFYFFYIGPFESSSFKNSFRSSLNSLMETEEIPRQNTFDDYNNNYVNISDDSSWNSYIGNLKFLSDQSEKERLDKNNILFINTIVYWNIFFASSLVLFLGSYFYKKYHIKKVKNIQHQRLIENNNKKSKKKLFFYQIVHYLLLAILILGFEYIFFQYIVLKYQIITNAELKYVIMNQIGRYFYTF